MTMDQEAGNSVRCHLHSPDTGAEADLTDSSSHQLSPGDCLLLFFTIVLAGGFEDCQEVRIVYHTGVCCVPDLYSTYSRGGRHQNGTTCNPPLSKLQHHHCEKGRYRLCCSSTMKVDDSVEQLPLSCMLVMGMDNGTSQCLIFQNNWELL